MDSTTLTYLHNDYLGSVSVTTDASGALLHKQEFDPWGNVRAGDVPETTLDYTGQRRDTTGLLYYNARYYDPVSGHFLSADTIVPGAGALTMAPNDSTARGLWGTGGNGPANLQDLNRYSYVNNNPVRNTDPTGHILDTLLDVAFIAYDVYDIAANGYSAEKGLALAADVGGALVPGLTGAGLAVKAMAHADDVAKLAAHADDAAKLGSHADEAVKAVGELAHTCKDCGTFKPDLVRGSGSIKIDPDGVSVFCRVCANKGHTPIPTNKNAMIRPFDAYCMTSCEGIKEYRIPMHKID